MIRPTVPAFERALRLAIRPRFLVLLVPPLISLLLPSLVSRSGFADSVFMLHFGAAIFVNMTVLVGVSALPASHPYRTEMVRNVLPNLWAFLIFLPLFVVLEPSPSTVWYGFSLASAGVINLVVHRKVLIPPSWGPSFPMFAFTAGLGAIAAVGASSHFDNGMFETEMLYGLYGLFSSLAVDGSRRRAEVLADGSESDSAGS